MSGEHYVLQPDGGWQPLALPGALAGRSGCVLPADGIASTKVRLGREHKLFVTLAAAEPAQADLLMRAGDAADWQLLARCAASPSQQLELSLAAHAGRDAEFCLAPVEGELHVLEFCICEAQQHGRLNAFTAYETRLANELKHFSGGAYTHRMYGESAAANARGEVTRAQAQGSSLAAWSDEVHARSRARLAALPAEPGEPAFTYAMRTLSELVPPHGRTFVDRVQEMSRRGPIRMLSLCAGAARIEEDLLAACEGPVQLTLVDASEDLLQRAAGRLGARRADHRIECLVGDVNEGLPGEGQYDVIVCVSALHHIADLERVLAAINLRLAEGGQFWSIGEQVGRNGNRLWPDALAAANRAFTRLPPHLRRNAHTGEIDAEVSDRDYSVGCFEGVRSEELETLMERYLVLSESYKRNAFLWRLVDGTYTDNYDLSRAEDLDHLRELIAAEVAHWASGGRSTEFYGVFRKKTV